MRRRFIRWRYRRPEAGEPAHRASMPLSSHHPFRRIGRGAGFGRRPACLLPQQHRQVARSDWKRRWRGGVARFIFSSTAAVYGKPGSVSGGRGRRRSSRCRPMARSKLMTEWMLRDTAAATRPRLCGAALFQCRGRRSQGAHRPVDAARHPSHQGRLRDGARQRGRISTSSAPTIRPPTAPASATISMSAISSPPMTRRLAICAAAAQAASSTAATAAAIPCSTSLPRWSGRRAGRCRSAMRPRRPGDPPAIVAGAERARQVLGWSPRHDDLDLIVASALAWERRLRQRNA